MYFYDVITVCLFGVLFVFSSVVVRNGKPGISYKENGIVKGYEYGYGSGYDIYPTPDLDIGCGSS